MPDVPGLKDFKGQLVHAQGFDSGAPWRGKNVLIIGVGNSAHDIAQDLHGHGAKVNTIRRIDSRPPALSHRIDEWPA